MVKDPGVYVRSKIRAFALLLFSTSSLSQFPPAICSIGLDMLFLQVHPYWSRNVGQKSMLVLALLLLTVRSLVYYLTKSQAMPQQLSVHNTVNSMVLTHVQDFSFNQDICPF